MSSFPEVISNWERYKFTPSPLSYVLYREDRLGPKGVRGNQSRKRKPDHTLLKVYIHATAEIPTMS